MALGCKNTGERFRQGASDWKGEDLPPNAINFDKSLSGPKNILPAVLSNELLIFSRIWDEKIFQLIHRETVLKISNAGKSVKIELDEIKRYLIASVVMGLNHQPEIQNYWNHEGTNLSIFGCSFIQQLISKSDWWKVNTWITYPVEIVMAWLNKNFQNYWSPFQHVAIDEILLLFKGRFKGRQHIRGKPHSTGLKFYALCDEFGYLYSFWLYRGKEKDPGTQQELSTVAVEEPIGHCSTRCKAGCRSCLCAKGKRTCSNICRCTNCKNRDPTVWTALAESKTVPAEDIKKYEDVFEEDEIEELILDKTKHIARRSAMVKDILTDFEREMPTDRAYVFLGDSYFGGLDEVRVLARKNRLALFTCNANRPSDVFAQNLDRGLVQGHFNFQHNEKEKIICVSFYDSKICHFVSNYVGVSPVGTSGRPHISTIYNVFMNGVDKFDCDLNRYLYHHRKQKWSRCLLHNLFKMAIVNSFKNFLAHRPGTQQITFILNLINKMFPNSSLKPPPSTQHIIVSTTSQCECQWCWQKRPEERIAGFRCSTCNAYLHPSCFADYHRKQ